MTAQIEDREREAVLPQTKVDPWRRFMPALTLLLTLTLTISCSHHIQVSSFTSVHKNVLRIDSGKPTDVASFVEGSSFLNEGRLVLRPSFEGMSITVEFGAIPREGETAIYQARDDRTNLENRFHVSTGIPAQNVVLDEYSAVLTRLRQVISDAEIESHLRANETIRTKYSFAYSIQWNDQELRGDIFMVETLHSESDPLLN